MSEIEPFCYVLGKAEDLRILIQRSLVFSSYCKNWLSADVVEIIKTTSSLYSDINCVTLWEITYALW